jgi:hypothetical protein
MEISASKLVAGPNDYLMTERHVPLTGLPECRRYTSQYSMFEDSMLTRSRFMDAVDKKKVRLTELASCAG